MQAQKQTFSNFAPCLFSWPMPCPSFTGRRAERHGHVIRRLGSEKQLPYIILDSGLWQNPADIQTAFLPRMWSGRRPVKEDMRNIWKRCRNKVKKGSALCSHKKRNLFLYRTAKPKTAMRFWFCIIDILLISERGRRRTDYLCGLTLSSAYENLENYMM